MPAAKKKSTTAKRTKKAKQQTIDAPMKNEFISIFIIAAALLTGVFLYAPSGIIGQWAKMLCTGLLGIPAYLLPPFLLVLGMHRLIGRAYEENKCKYTQTLLVILCLAGLFQLFSGIPAQNPFWLTSLSGYWWSGSNGIGGGIFGGILCDIFANTVGRVAAGIILFTLFIVLIMILTKWSPLKALLRFLVRCFMDIKEVRREAADEAAVMPPREKKPRAAKRAIPNFSDEDVTRGTATEKPKKAVQEKAAEPKAESTASETDMHPQIEDEPTYDFKNLDAILDQVLPPEEKSAVSALAKAETFSHAEAAPATPADDDVPWETTPAEEDAHTPVQHSTAADAPAEKAEPLTDEENEDISQEMEEAFEKIPYTFPDFDLLDKKSAALSADSREELRETASKLIATLRSFNVDAELLHVSKGPTVTRYELKPAAGVKVSKIVGLSDDIALRLAATGVRIEAPIPNKEAIGIEIPNKTVATVSIREVLDSDEFKNFSSKLAFALGKDIAGKNVVVDLAKMPHILIAGATGSGKSVCINTLIASIIYKADPNEVKLLMIDPKVVELNVYNGIPHLMIPVVTDPRRASGALYWAVQEMTRRYAVFAEYNVRNLEGYNNAITEAGGENTMPHVVIIIDELADLMMVAPGEVEDSICRLAQLARAAGIHLVIATQRPSVDVITGIIKANIPSRIAFAVSSQVDSRTILDSAGAEKLLGRGDMLFSPVGAAKPKRLQGAFISDKEVERIVEFIKNGSVARYDEDVLEKIENGKTVNVSGNDHDPGDNDEFLPRAIEIAVDTGKISASYLQRRLKIGFSRAARIVDQMEERGWIGPQDGSKPREVLLSKEDYMEMSMRS